MDSPSNYYVLHNQTWHTRHVIVVVCHVRDTTPPAYCILLQSPSSDFSYVISMATTQQKINRDWQWLQKNLVETSIWLLASPWLLTSLLSLLTFPLTPSLHLVA